MPGIAIPTGLPANRGGSRRGAGLGRTPLKIMQEAITLIVFVQCAMFYLSQPFKRDEVRTALCLAGAVFFILRS
ncbi:uncharacterized protein (DUF486 family) [Actimicrobium sp. GrIS 1.19]|uniref:DMT family protein n=1 Tax=Actimicrobium sp. GrIS 1.19 TaxID=3071708 RepID=UPI002DFDE8D9|nr:uncharacterized protein (DUF486 family) [Actimicrobium sp. GrIS 1.19]